MKCKFYGCQKEAANGFPCCGFVHGSMHKEAMQLAQAYQENTLLGYGEYLIELWQPEQLAYYLEKKYLSKQ